MLHTTAGYLAGAHVTTKYVFDLRDDDLYWCTADVGWVTGHSYIVYGPLSCGASCLHVRRRAELPRLGPLLEHHRAARRHDPLHRADGDPRVHPRGRRVAEEARSLDACASSEASASRSTPRRGSGTTASIGGERCPIVDTWWQTETGAIMLTTLPGACFAKPGCTGLPFFGVDIAVVKDGGDAVRARTRAASSSSSGRGRRWRARSGATTSATSRRTGTSMPGVYFTGDGARRDEDGYFWVVGRIDDVLNVAGHRIGTAEIESALVSHPAVAEAAAVGRPDDLKGQALVVFVTLKAGPDGGQGAEGRARPRTSTRRSASSPGPTRSASPTRCPRRAAERSCGAS